MTVHALQSVGYTGVLGLGTWDDCKIYPILKLLCVSLTSVNVLSWFHFALSPNILGLTNRNNISHVVNGFEKISSNGLGHWSTDCVVTSKYVQISMIMIQYCYDGFPWCPGYLIYQFLQW